MGNLDPLLDLLGCQLAAPFHRKLGRTVLPGEVHAPKKRPGRTPKVDERTERLLNEDMKERPAATITERVSFLEVIAGKRLSYSTVWRLLKRLGWSRKKDQWVHQSETSGEGLTGR